MVSCSEEEQASKAMEQALGVYLSTTLEEEHRVDSSLILTNMALDLDHQHIPALNHKSVLLFRKKDIEGLIEVADQLIKIRPDAPAYLTQKAFYLELKGDTLAAQELYKSALSMYHNYLEAEPQDFDLMMEYVGVLEASGDTISARATLAKMKSMPLEDYQLEMIELYKSQSISRERFKRYLGGEITFDEIDDSNSDSVVL